MVTNARDIKISRFSSLNPDFKKSEGSGLQTLALGG
jgi:hypothetical protein